MGIVVIRQRNRVEVTHGWIDGMDGRMNRLKVEVRIRYALLIFHTQILNN
jgi:hypothetical protein